jgi:hypothetical protein
MMIDVSLLDNKSNVRPSDLRGFLDCHRASFQREGCHFHSRLALEVFDLIAKIDLKNKESKKTEAL